MKYTETNWRQQLPITNHGCGPSRGTNNPKCPSSVLNVRVSWTARARWHRTDFIFASIGVRKSKQHASYNEYLFLAL